MNKKTTKQSKNVVSDKEILQVNKDIKAIETYMKKGYKFVWFLPLVGCFIYSKNISKVRDQIKSNTIARNMELAIEKWMPVLIWSLLAFIINFLPFVKFAVWRKAIKLSKEEISPKVKTTKKSKTTAK